MVDLVGQRIVRKPAASTQFMHKEKGMKTISQQQNGGALNNVSTSRLMLMMAAILAFCVPDVLYAATTGVEFQGLYDFVYGAATGYLGRAIAIVGGLIGLGFGAASGKPVIAIVGIVLAVFGALGPTIVNTIFASAVI